jgi:hypothetical protein
MNLEPIRNALSTEPLLALGAGDAVLACDAKELVFADTLGVQRLELRAIRKVTHLEGQLVVTSSADSIRGVLNVESAELKAFFADVQTLRKQRDAGVTQPLESRFKPAVPESLSRSPLEQTASAPLEVTVPAALEIPGFKVGLSVAPAEVKAPRVAPAVIPAAPISISPIEPLPVAAPVKDFLQYQPRPPKPNPRAVARVEPEGLPPRKPNPRAAVVPPAGAPALEPASAAIPQQPAPEPPSVSVAPEQPRRQARPTAPLEKTGSAPLEKTGSPALEKSRAAPIQRPRAAPLEQPRVAKPAQASIDVSAIWQGLQNRFAQASPNLRFNLRRTAASAIDAALSLLLMWMATRIIGGRELETLLRLPSDTRADLSMLESLKDLLPLFIAGALSGVLIALAAGLLYAVVSALSPLCGTPGKHLMGLRLTLLDGARAGPAVIAGRYLVAAMLLLVPSVLGLLPTLIALNGPAIALRSSLQLFGTANLAGVIVLLIGQLPIYGRERSQTLADYLTDCTVRDAPKTAALEQ